MATPARGSSRRRRSWNALKSAYHAYSGLFWVAPRTPSLRLGLVVMAVLAGAGVLLHLSFLEIAVLIGIGTVLLAVETLNTAIEMLCDRLVPERDEKIGKIKDVAAGATAVAEIGGGVMLLLLLGPHVGRLLAG